MMTDFVIFLYYEGVDYEYKSVNPRTDPGNSNALTHLLLCSCHLIHAFTRNENTRTQEGSHGDRIRVIC
jgi:hypothetical protein